MIIKVRYRVYIKIRSSYHLSTIGPYLVIV